MNLVVKVRDNEVWEKCHRHKMNNKKVETMEVDLKIVQNSCLIVGFCWVLSEIKQKVSVDGVTSGFKVSIIHQNFTFSDLDILFRLDKSALMSLSRGVMRNLKLDANLGFETFLFNVKIGQGRRESPLPQFYLNSSIPINSTL